MNRDIDTSGKSEINIDELKDKIHLRGGVFLFLLVCDYGRKPSRYKVHENLIWILKKEPEMACGINSIHPANDSRYTTAYIQLAEEQLSTLGLHTEAGQAKYYEDHKKSGFGSEHNRLLKAFHEHIVKKYMYDSGMVCTQNDYDRCEKIVKRLLWIIIHDQDIAENEPFYILENGNKAVTKADLISAFVYNDSDIPYHICLESFLLGVWFYAGTHRNVERGTETSYSLISENGAQGTGASFKEGIDQQINKLLVRPINLTFYDSNNSTDSSPQTEKTSPAPECDPVISNEPEKESGTSKPRPSAVPQFTSLSDALKNANLSGRLSVQYEPKAGRGRKNIVFICGSNGCGKTFLVRTWIKKNLSYNDESRYRQYLYYNYIDCTVYKYIGESDGSISSDRFDIERNKKGAITPKVLFDDYRSRSQKIRQALVIDSFFEQSPIQGWKELFDEITTFNDANTDIFVITSCDPTYFSTYAHFPFTVFCCNSTLYATSRSEFLRAAGIDEGSKDIDMKILDMYCSYYSGNISILRDTGKLIRENLITCEEFNNLVYHGAGFDDLCRVVNNNSRANENMVWLGVQKKIKRCYDVYTWLMNKTWDSQAEKSIIPCAYHILYILWKTDMSRAVQLGVRMPAMSGKGYTFRFRYYAYSQDRSLIFDFLKTDIQHELAYDEIKDRVEHMCKEANHYSITKTLSWLCGIGAIREGRFTKGMRYYFIDKYLMVAMDVCGGIPLRLPTEQL